MDQGATSCCASGALYFLLSAAAGLDERGVRAEGGAGHPALEEVVWATVATGVRQPKGLCSPAAAPSAPTPYCSLVAWQVEIGQFG